MSDRALNNLEMDPERCTKCWTRNCCCVFTENRVGELCPLDPSPLIEGSHLWDVVVVW